MERTQVLFQLLKNQAQTFFWKCTASAQRLASPTAVSAYKSSFMEFLQYAAEQHHLKKINQVRKRHVTGYIEFLMRERNSEFLIAKRVYAVCFWLGMIDENPERFPHFMDFALENQLITG